MSVSFVVYAGPCIPIAADDENDYDALVGNVFRVIETGPDDKDIERYLVPHSGVAIPGIDRNMDLRRDSDNEPFEPGIEGDMGAFLNWLCDTRTEDCLNAIFPHWQDSAKWMVLPYFY